MNLLSCARGRLARVMLRGRALDWWVLRRGRQLDAAYRAELTKTLDAACVPVRHPDFAASDRLRQILLIANCQWEQNDLVPELARIADTRLLDLSQALKGALEGAQARKAVTEP